MKLFGIALACALLIIPTSAFATTFDSDLSVSTTFVNTVADSPLMVGNYGNQNYLGANPDCPMILGNHSYAIQVFSTQNSGNHDMETVAATGGIDTFIALYSPTFDPNNITANLVTCDDDGGASWPLSKITDNLTANQQYTVVVTTWNANPVDGTISWEILPDIVLASPASVPTLSEWGIIIFSVMLLVFAIRTMRRNDMGAAS